MQDNAYLDISTILLALISSDARAAAFSVRVPVTPTSFNGLRSQSYVTVHDLVTVCLEKLGKHVGRLEDDLMLEVDRALIIFLGLDQ